MTAPETAPITCTHREVVLENPFVRVYRDDVVFTATGRPGSYVHMASAKPGEGVVLLVRHRDRLALVRTYRYPLGVEQVALPRGFGEDEDCLRSAALEACEELGVTLREARVLGRMTPDSGVLATRVAVVLAEADDEGTGPTDVEEVSEVEWVQESALADRVAAGEIEDGFTLSALAMLWSQR